MSILTKSKSVISIKQNQSHDLDGWPSKSRSSWLFPDRSHFGCIYDYRLDLHDDFIVFDATDLTVIKIFTWTQRMTLKIEVEVTYCDPLFIMGCIRDTGSFLLSSWVYPMLRILKWLKFGTWPPQLTSKIKAKHFEMTFIISGWIPAKDLFLVLILTKSKNFGKGGASTLFRRFRLAKYLRRLLVYDWI